jgi:hypothetical protein
MDLLFCIKFRVFYTYIEFLQKLFFSFILSFFAYFDDKSGQTAHKLNFCYKCVLELKFATINVLGLPSFKISLYPSLHKSFPPPP